MLSKAKKRAMPWYLPRRMEINQENIIIRMVAAVKNTA
jgi:hypothetical protein